MSKKVAVVTGSNKGVGLGIVRALCQKFDGDVYLTARDEGRGKEAVEALRQEGLQPCFHQLDITDHASIERLRDFLKGKYGGLDVLVNNVGISYKGNDPAPFSEQATVTNQTNFFATLDCCKTLFPLLRKGSRVSTVSSFGSQMSLRKCSDALRARFTDPSIQMEELISLIQQFIDKAQDGSHEAAGFSNSAYGMSKVGVTVMTIVQQREVDERGGKEQDIAINCCCPGYVNTDLSSGKGTKTIDEGAITPVFCALLPPNTDIRGKFVRNEQVEEWKM